MSDLNTRIGSLFNVPHFTAQKEQEITLDMVGQFIKLHEDYQQRYKLLMDYFMGKHAIQNRSLDADKPNTKPIDNFAEYITNVKTGYFMGRPVRYALKEDATTEEGFKELSRILEYNDEQDNNNELSKLASIYGHAFELHYLDEDGQPRFRYMSPREMFMIYDTDIEQTPLGAVRYYTVIVEDEEVVKGELYLPDKWVKFEANGEDLVSIEEKPHSFGSVPVVEFINNDERLGDFEAVITLIDAYELVMADSVNEVQYFNDAYLVIKNLLATDSTDIQDMKNNRIISLDENGEADWLTKNINDTHVQNVLDRIQTDIHRFSKAPNLADENFASNLSGVAIRFKLWGLEQDAINKERKFKKGLQRRFEILGNFLSNIWKIEANWMDIKIIFTRNIPTNVLEQSQVVANLNGVVSRKTLLSVLPFIEDPEAELKLLEEEDQKAVDSLGFPTVGNIPEDDEEDLEEGTEGAE